MTRTNIASSDPSDASPWPTLEAGAAEAAADITVDSLAGRLAYSVAEAAFITGLSRDLLYDQMRIGKLDYLKVGRRRIITRQMSLASVMGPGCCHEEGTTSGRD